MEGAGPVGPGRALATGSDGEGPTNRSWRGQRADSESDAGHRFRSAGQPTRAGPADLIGPEGNQETRRNKAIPGPEPVPSHSALQWQKEGRDGLTKETGRVSPDECSTPPSKLVTGPRARVRGRPGR